MAFSVLMSVYKKERPEYLREAVESVFAQSLVPDEVVLMEDGPLTEELYQMIATLEKRYPALRVCPLKMYSLDAHLQRAWKCAQMN